MIELFDAESYDFRSYWIVAVRLRWRILAIVIAAVALSAWITSRMKRIYEAQASILIEKADWGVNPVQEEVGVDTRNEDYYTTQYEILRSRSLATQVAAEINAQKYEEFKDSSSIVDTLQRDITIEPVPFSRIVHILAHSQNPQLAANIANTVAKLYIDQNVQSQSFLSQGVLRLLGNTASKSDIESLPAVVGSPLISALKIRLNTLEDQRVSLSHRYTPKHRKMTEIAAQINGTRAQIERETHNIAESVKSQLSMRLKINNVRLVDEAQPPKSPVRPRPQRNMILGAGFGLFLSFVMLILEQQMDRTIHSLEQLEKVTKLPCLTTLPKIARLSYETALHQIWSSEMTHHLFRNLRSVVALKIASIPLPNAILITSSIQGEGKSLVSSNLAAAFTQAGEKLLIIDADLRAPTLHKYFKMPMAKGFSTYLAAGGNPENHFYQSGVKNLYVMPAGPRIANPAEMLTRERLEALLVWAKGRVHRIIVDTPPVISTTEALIWAKYVQSAIFVVRAGTINIGMIEQALQKLRSVSMNIIGAVLNQAAEIPSAYYYYGDQGRPR